MTKQKSKTDTEHADTKGKAKAKGKDNETVKKVSKKSTVFATPNAGAKKASASASAAEANSEDVFTNVTLITSGFRSRLVTDGERIIATLEGKDWNTQAELHELWEKAVLGVPDDDFVTGADELGIFSERFGAQVAQIAPLENIWGYSTGLGMVNMSAKYPQYDLGEFDASIKGIVEDGVDERAWWKFVCDLSGNSITSVVTKAINRDERVVIALPIAQNAMLRDDLRELTSTVDVKKIRSHVRIVGPDLEGILEPSLLPCLMPFDREALNRLVPGVRAHGIRRMALLYLSVCGDKIGSTPKEDYDALMDAFEDETRRPIHYDTQSTMTSSSKVRLSDNELREKVLEYADVCGMLPERIRRMMRADNYAVSTKSVEEVVNQLSK